MMTSSNGNIFCVTGLLCGEFTGHRWIPPHKGPWRRALMFSLICARINLSKQSWVWWLESPSWSLWHHCNVIHIHILQRNKMLLNHIRQTIINQYLANTKYNILFYNGDKKTCVSLPIPIILQFLNDILLHYLWLWPFYINMCDI